MRATAIAIDEQLLVKAAQQDPTRFAELYERNFERVYAYVARRVRDRDEAEDVTADVFHQALANIGRFEWRGVPVIAWLLGIAANVIASRWRNDRSGLEDPADALDDAGVQEEIESRAMLGQLVESLPEDQRRVIIARFVEQHSIVDIARELGRSEGAVKQLQFRALQNLRALVRGNNE